MIVFGEWVSLVGRHPVTYVVNSNILLHSSTGESLGESLDDDTLLSSGVGTSSSAASDALLRLSFSLRALLLGDEHWPALALEWRQQRTHATRTPANSAFNIR